MVRVRVTVSAAESEGSERTRFTLVVVVWGRQALRRRGKEEA